MRYISYYPILTSLFISCTLLTSCSKPQVNKNESLNTKLTTEKVYKIPVETVTLSRQNINNIYKTTAVLAARSESKVINNITGMLIKVLVEEGMHVTKGQILAQIADENYQLEYERASIELGAALSEYNRSKPIKGRQLISAKDLEKLEYRVKSKQNQQKITAIKVKESKIRAPIDGVIANKMVKVGNMIGSATEMFHIVDLNTLQAIIYLPESKMTKVYQGQQASLYFPNQQNKVIGGKVALISPIIDVQSGTFKITLTINDNNSNLKPGMFAKVSLLLAEHKNVQVVPLNALVMNDNETSLFLIKNNTAQRVFIETGFEQNGLIEVTTPLKNNSDIVVVGQQSLKDGSLVTHINSNQDSEQKNKIVNKNVINKTRDKAFIDSEKVI